MGILISAYSYDVENSSVVLCWVCEEPINLDFDDYHIEHEPDCPNRLPVCDEIWKDCDCESLYAHEKCCTTCKEQDEKENIK